MTSNCPHCGKSHTIDPNLDQGDTIRCECGAELEITALKADHELSDVPEDEKLSIDDED